MPRGIYERKTVKKKAAKKNIKTRQSGQFKIDIDSVLAAQQTPKINVIVKKDELDIMRDIFADFESLNEDGRYRVMAYFFSKYQVYAPDNAR